jgi:hypothetical protein
MRMAGRLPRFWIGRHPAAEQSSHNLCGNSIQDAAGKLDEDRETGISRSVLRGAQLYYSLG